MKYLLDELNRKLEIAEKGICELKENKRRNKEKKMKNKKKNWKQNKTKKHNNKKKQPESNVSGILLNETFVQLEFQEEEREERMRQECL